MYALAFSKEELAELARQIGEILPQVLAVNSNLSLPEQYRELLPLYADAANLRQLAAIKHDELEMEYELWWGDLYISMWDTLEKKFGRAPNMSSVGYMIRKEHEQEYREWQASLRSARILVARLEDLKYTIGVRREIIMSASADVRTEMKF